jgi:hypothetical protein
MRPTEWTKYAEIRVKEILAMASVWNSVVDDLLKYHLHSCFTMEGQIFTVASDYLAIALQSFLHWCVIGTFVLNETLWTNVLHMLSSGYV